MDNNTMPDTPDEGYVDVPVTAPGAAAAHRRWPTLVAAGAGVALVAGTAFAAGWLVRPAESDASGTSIDAPSTAHMAPGSAAAVERPASSSLADDKRAASDSFRPGGYGSRTVFTASGLSADAGTAHSWALDGSAWYSDDIAARLAAALGVTGDPVKQDQAWSVGPIDGSGTSVTVSQGSPAWFNAYNPAIDPWCTPGDATTQVEPQTAAGAPGATDSAPSAGSAPDQGLTTCVAPSGAAPSADSAITTVRGIATAIGVDPDSLSYDVTDPATTGTTTATMVTATMLVDGKPIDQQWSAIITADGVQSISGSLGTPVDLGEYPVVSAKDAVKRLNDVRFGVSNVLYAMDSSAMTDGMLRGSAAEAQPALPSPGSAIAWPVSQVTITGATLGLASSYNADGGSRLVPTWSLTDGSGSVWSVIAVADSALDFATR